MIFDIQDILIFTDTIIYAKKQRPQGNHLRSCTLSLVSVSCRQLGCYLGRPQSSRVGPSPGPWDFCALHCKQPSQCGTRQRDKSDSTPCAEQFNCAAFFCLNFFTCCTRTRRQGSGRRRRRGQCSSLFPLLSAYICMGRKCRSAQLRQ